MEDSDSDSSGCKAPPREGAIRLIHIIQSDVLTGGIIRFIEIFSRMPDVNILILSDVKTISNKTLLKHLRKLPKARILAVKLPLNLPKTLKEACFALLAIFRALSSRKCIDVAYSDENLRGVLAGFALRTLAKKPWICTFQGLWEFSGLQKALSRLTMKISSYATAIVVPSQSVKEKLLRYARKLADKVHVIESGIDPSLFKPMSLKKELDCIYVGRISWEKGIDVLLRAWSIVLKEKPDAKLGIVGDGNFKGDDVEDIGNDRNSKQKDIVWRNPKLHLLFFYAAGIDVHNRISCIFNKFGKCIVVNDDIVAGDHLGGADTYLHHLTHELIQFHHILPHTFSSSSVQS